uniref:Prostate-associated microseminoprotein n=1 Tax=Neogobius melanostomus TaxID=47308 RepID=A0A8C6UDB7_9GOBI
FPHVWRWPEQACGPHGGADHTSDATAAQPARDMYKSKDVQREQTPLCVFAGKHYTLGETWMDDACMQCTCLHPVGVGCCETAHRPVDFPAWCEVRVEPVTCKVSLVQTADPRLPCFPGDQQDPSHGEINTEIHNNPAPVL